MSIYVPEDELHVPKIELGIYEHFKGKQYEVLGVALHSETNEPMVVYKPLYETVAPLWVRPYAMFIDTVQVDRIEVPRFKKI